MAATTKDSVARDTAMAQRRQALSRVEDVPPAARLGLFSGWLGIVLSAVRISIILQKLGDTCSQALRLLRRCCEKQIETQEFDLMSGNAGAIAALVVLEQMLCDSALLDLAEKLGMELFNRATKSDSGGLGGKSAAWTQLPKPHWTSLYGAARMRCRTSRTLSRDGPVRLSARLGAMHSSMKQAWFESGGAKLAGFPERSRIGPTLKDVALLIVLVSWGAGNRDGPTACLRDFELQRVCGRSGRVRN